MSIDITEPTALYIQIANHIKSQIDSSVLNPGDQLESHQVLTKKYDVSLITIKKALSELINEKILFGRVGKVTYVSEINKQLNLTDHLTIGLVLRELNSPFFSRIVESVEKKASEMSCNLMISASLNSPEKEAAHIDRYIKLGVRGLIISTTAHVYHASAQIRQLRSKSFPYCIISYMEDQDINHVGTDHAYGAYIATKHLINLGYKKIGYINCEIGYPLGEVRKSGYLRALNEFGVPFNKDFVFRLSRRGDWRDYQSGYKIGQKFCLMSKKPDAMFIYNDMAALGFEKVVLEKGLNVPEDVAIVGYDNIKRSWVAPVPLTTVDQRTNEMGCLAIEMILNQINGKPYKSITILKPRLVIRDSCGAKKLKVITTN